MKQARRLPMKVSTKSWHYKFLGFMSNWHELDPKRRASHFKSKVGSMTKCDYILRISFISLSITFWLMVAASIITMMIIEALLIPTLIFVFIIGSIIVVCKTYTKFNAKCNKIEMIDEEETQ
jgi:hypothetical protein